MPEPAPWLLLLHNIPPKPPYFRAKVARRLAVLGAVALKNAVYVLPNQPQCREDLDWLVQEIKEGGGKAFLVEARLAGGVDDAQVRVLFQDARERDYADLVDKAKHLAAGLHEMDRDAIRTALLELRRQLQAIQALDFFGAPGRDTMEGLLAGMESDLRGQVEREILAAGQVAERIESFRGKIWVTRFGVHVDRMASAWLILRFIDSEARFCFVATSDHQPASGEVTFDMQGADFTHEKGRCTFETLILRLGMQDTALDRLGEMVHDIDLRASPYRHQATEGLALALAGVTLRHSKDAARIEAGRVLLDAVYEALRLQTPVAPDATPGTLP